MTKKEDHENFVLEVMVGGIRIALNHSVTNIERVTEYFDEQFEGLNARKLPEYKKALSAIKKYEAAFVKHFTKKYNEK